MDKHELEPKYRSVETQTEEKIFVEKSTQTYEIIRKSSTTPPKKSQVSPVGYRRTPRKNYKEESSDEETKKEDHNYYPNKKKQKNSNKNQEQEFTTCIPVNRIPELFKEFVDMIPIEDYDSYAIETLFLNCALDKSFKDEDEVFQYVYNTVFENEQFRIDNVKWKNPIPQPSYDEEFDQKMIEKYNELMNSEEQQRLRSWRRDSPFMKKWTKKEWDKFEQYYKEFPDGPNSNRLIALKMGGGIHPNHVAHYKRIFKKNKKESDEKKEEKKE